jgi:hypothetical protein
VLEGIYLLVYPLLQFPLPTLRIARYRIVTWLFCPQLGAAVHIVLDPDVMVRLVTLFIGMEG